MRLNAETIRKLGRVQALAESAQGSLAQGTPPRYVPRRRRQRRLPPCLQNNPKPPRRRRCGLNSRATARDTEEQAITAALEARIAKAKQDAAKEQEDQPMEDLQAKNGAPSQPAARRRRSQAKSGVPAAVPNPPDVAAMVAQIAELQRTFEEAKAAATRAAEQAAEETRVLKEKVVGAIGEVHDGDPCERREVADSRTAWKRRSVPSVLLGIVIR
jgi:hypothetical protein